ncbi:hypothetical protein D3C87_1527570 [compost metagenome]
MEFHKAGKISKISGSDTPNDREPLISTLFNIPTKYATVSRFSSLRYPGCAAADLYSMAISTINGDPLYPGRIAKVSATNEFKPF